MKTLLITVLLFTVNTVWLYANTTVSGSILSTNGQPLPVATIDVTATGPTNVFTLPEKTFVDENGNFSITFENPGIYTLIIRGVFHKTARIPLLIYDQDSVGMDIHLLPNTFNDGEYFDQQVYLKWIRAFGNFNDYDFFSGEIFRANEDGSISAFINTKLDTIRYQVRGITRGITVLPGADAYAEKGPEFEAILYNRSDADSVELRFHPGEPQPYANILPDGPVSWQIPLSAFVHFHNISDKYWSLPLERTQSTRLQYRTLSKPAKDGVPADFLKESMYRSYDFNSTQYMSAFRDSVTKALKTNDLHPQQRSALLISYVGLIEQQRTRERYLESIDQEPPELLSDVAIFEQIFETVDPRNPVWALNDDAPLVLLEETNYSDKAVTYTERMVRQHADEMVVRYLVLDLIKRFAGNYNDIREMPHYNWIVERYGENNLARRAILAFRQSKNS